MKSQCVLNVKGNILDAVLPMCHPQPHFFFLINKERLKEVKNQD